MKRLRLPHESDRTDLVLQQIKDNAKEERTCVIVPRPPKGKLLDPIKESRL